MTTIPQEQQALQDEGKLDVFFANVGHLLNEII